MPRPITDANWPPQPGSALSSRPCCDQRSAAKRTTRWAIASGGQTRSAAISAAVIGCKGLAPAGITSPRRVSMIW